MPAVEIALTETYLWSWSANTHADLIPSVVPGTDGRTLVVGEPLAPPSIAVSPVQLAAADRIAYEPGMPKPVDALAAVFGHTLEQLRIPAPCERLTVVHPTEWDPHRLAVLEAAADRYGNEVVLQPTALRAVTASRRVRDVRTVVLEFGPLSTTASTVVPAQEGPRLEYCEHEPVLAAAEIVADDQGAAAFRALLERLLHGCPVSAVIIVGRADADFADLIASVVADLGHNAELVVVAGADLVRVQQSETAPVPSGLPPAQRDSEWLQPLRERAAATRPPRSRTPLYIGAAVLLAAAVLIGGGTVLVRATGGTSETVASPPPPSAGPTSVRPTPESETDSGPVTLGAVRLTVPNGWRLAQHSTDPGRRLELLPGRGLRARITVLQQPLAADTGYDRVAATLEDQIARRPAGSVSALRRDAVFAGRPGLAYTEYPEDGSIVDWHVIVEHSTQISIGCQYQTGGQDSITPICEDLATSLDVIP